MSNFTPFGVGCWRGDGRVQKIHVLSGAREVSTCLRHRHALPAVFYNSDKALITEGFSICIRRASFESHATVSTPATSAHATADAPAAVEPGVCTSEGSHAPAAVDVVEGHALEIMLLAAPLSVGGAAEAEAE